MSKGKKPQNGKENSPLSLINLAEDEIKKRTKEKFCKDPNGRGHNCKKQTGCSGLRR